MHTPFLILLIYISPTFIIIIKLNEIYKQTSKAQKLPKIKIHVPVNHIKLQDPYII